ncbi:hypothetical protein [Streptomyces sp. NPDC001678]|uniref:hypothetical protein n=1 Tax=Streptomyces sp. NPDC001678 TaxID=3364599 RepID=UPI00368364E7
MSMLKFRRRTAARAAATAVLAGALLAPAASALAAGSDSAPGATTAQTAWAASKRAAASEVRAEKLVDGSIAVITKLGPQHYRLENLANGYVTGRLEADKQDAGGNFNGMFVVLDFGGRVASWTGNQHRGPGSFALPDGSTAEVTKVGDHHYTLNVVYDGYVTARLDADNRNAAVNANSMFIVLTPGGTFSSFIPTKA